MKTVCVIPARYASTRFPGKALADIDGKSLIRRVYDQAKLCPELDDVLVATDDDRILDHVTEFGGKAVMTSDKHQSGADRIAETMQLIDADLVIDAQGDEPLLPPQLITDLIGLFKRDPKLVAATAAHIFEDENDIDLPDMVKVVVDKQFNALYFSRAPIPYVVEQDKNELCSISTDWRGPLRHIGIYAFTKRTLMEFTKTAPSPLERLERLEQLRLIENGIKIKILITDYKPIAVDVPEDIEKVIEVLRRER